MLPIIISPQVIVTPDVQKTLEENLKEMNSKK